MTLEPAVYWKLRAICADVQRCYLVAAQSKQAFDKAQQKQTELLVALGLDPQKNVLLDDDNLVVTEG